MSESETGKYRLYGHFVAKEELSMRQWTSLHFFIHDFARINHFLLNGLNTLSQEELANVFFIRYWEGGPHVRVRFSGNICEQSIRKMMLDYWDENGFSAELVAPDYYASYRQYMESTSALEIHANGSIQNIPYQREHSRYGGLNGLLICERFFCQDSVRTLQVLALGETKAESLLFYYCLAFADAAKSAGVAHEGLLDLVGLTQQAALDFVRQKVTKRFESSSTQYMHMHELYVQGTVYPDILQPLQRDLQLLLVDLQHLSVENIDAILSSLLHMSFNRAGIAPFKESTLRYFAHLTQNSKEYFHATKAV